MEDLFNNKIEQKLNQLIGDDIVKQKRGVGEKPTAGFLPLIPR